ncbi:MAG: outer membrane beta-barrel protein [Bacteroidales bacterium]|nr:outer membrane beta-barrel protein [Bacteroidales bacterium]
MKRIILILLAMLLMGMGAWAQNQVSATLLDAASGEPVGYATVSLTRKGAVKPMKYMLSDAEGRVRLDGVRAGTYEFKAELLGYRAFVKEITVPGGEALGEIAMQLDREQLAAATVSDVGNPIVIKKDTIEYNASSFKTTDNDVLEDLLKKLPGVEVGDDGSITVNGETISKITIDGKTFFLDDPQLASKNIPAKVINKLKVIEKKSEQAEFTGIDDGEEEHVIDLSIKPGMMKGWFGNLMAGAGHDIPVPSGAESLQDAGDWRYQGAAFAGKFDQKSQLSFIFNGNNTNNRAFNDLAGSMMGSMRGGGSRGGYGGPGSGFQGSERGESGITTSYMAGVNGVWDLFRDKMELGGNYLFNYTDKDVESENRKLTYLDGDRSMLYKGSGLDKTTTHGHRFGIRLEHKFSENTSILFQPQFNFGGGSYVQQSDSWTRDGAAETDPLLNASNVNNTGANRNWTASGFFLLRQRLGIPGRTLTFMARYSYSDNHLAGTNRSLTSYYQSGQSDVEVNQTFTTVSDSWSLMGRLTYTEPLGNHFYIEGNYGYNYSRSHSNKETFDVLTGQQAYPYSNDVVNTSDFHTIGANFMYQRESSRFQIGASVIPTTTKNQTVRYDSTTGQYGPADPYTRTIWRWSPQAMAWWEMGENANARLFYRGTSSQPAISKLMPVPDNADPLNVSFGNANLNPYFSHTLRGDVRYNDKRTFTSFNVRFSGGFTQDPVVSLLWYGGNGAQYTLPVNGSNAGNASISGFLNAPVARSNFSISNTTRVSWSNTSSYVGTDIDMTQYETGGDYYAFMDDFLAKIHDRKGDYWQAHVTENTTNTIGLTERLRVTYRADNLELQLSGRTRMNHSWYTLNKSNTLTWNNQLRAGVNWTWDWAGMTVKSEFNYNWYNGYATAIEPEYVWDAEIQKQLFRKKVTLALKGYDILGTAKSISVTDTENYHTESRSNMLGRYVILSLTYRFGMFDRSKMRGPGGPMGGPPPMR